MVGEVGGRDPEFRDGGGAAVRGAEGEGDVRARRRDRLFQMT